MSHILACSIAGMCMIACAASNDPSPVSDELPAGTTPERQPSSKESATNPPPPKCPYEGEPVDTNEFEKCLDGGVCIPESLVPADEQERLTRANCDQAFCVPAKIVAKKGIYLPPSCSSIAGGEGRCMSIVFPDIDEQKGELPQDTCEANERCVPCHDPIEGKPTGACSSVACDSPKKPAVVFGNCCSSKGRCVPSSMVPSDKQSNLAVDSCVKDKELCVPSEQLKEDWVPPRCQASALTGPYDGVCISECIPRDFLGQIGTAKGNCADGFFCAPCKKPFTGEPTGAPGC